MELYKGTMNVEVETFDINQLNRRNKHNKEKKVTKMYLLKQVLFKNLNNLHC